MLDSVYKLRGNIHKFPLSQISRVLHKNIRLIFIFSAEKLRSRFVFWRFFAIKEFHGNFRQNRSVKNEPAITIAYLYHIVLHFNHLIFEKITWHFSTLVQNKFHHSIWLPMDNRRWSYSWENIKWPTLNNTLNIAQYQTLYSCLMH